MADDNSLWIVIASSGLLALACAGEGPVQGVRGACAHAGGTLLECERTAIENAEDACWKLVECGVIPLFNEADNRVDWPRCVASIEGLDDLRFDYALACIETSGCDDLKVEGSPTEPRWLPLCVHFGDQ